MGDRRFAWLMCGLLVAVLVSALVGPARAQGTSDSDFSAATGQISPSGPPPSGVVRPSAQDIDDLFGAPTKAATAPEGDPAESSTEPDQTVPGSNAGQAGDDQDSDPNLPAEPPAANDGGVDGRGMLLGEDGVDATAANPDDPDPVALFENPPAPSDPLLYQIEDLDPIRDNRTPRRLFKQEPYDPVGIQIGGFVLFPELVIGGSWFSNVFHAPSAKSDVALDVLPAARLVSNWGRHALEFRAIGGFSFYDQYQTEDQKNYLLEARGRLRCRHEQPGPRLHGLRRDRACLVGVEADAFSLRGGGRQSAPIWRSGTNGPHQPVIHGRTLSLRRLLRQHGRGAAWRDKLGLRHSDLR